METPIVQIVQIKCNQNNQQKPKQKSLQAGLEDLQSILALAKKNTIINRNLRKHSRIYDFGKSYCDCDSFHLLQIA